MPIRQRAAKFPHFISPRSELEFVGGTFGFRADLEKLLSINSFGKQYVSSKFRPAERQYSVVLPFGIVERGEWKWQFNIASAFLQRPYTCRKNHHEINFSYENPKEQKLFSGLEICRCRASSKIYEYILQLHNIGGVI